MRVEITLDCNDLERLARFWAAVLDYRREPSDVVGYVTLSTSDGSGLTLTLQQVTELKRGKNRMHPDLLVGDLDAEIRRVESLGATRSTAEIVRMYGQSWIVMADPEGNEFCLAAGAEM